MQKQLYLHQVEELYIVKMCGQFVKKLNEIYLDFRVF